MKSRMYATIIYQQRTTHTLKRKLQEFCTAQGLVYPYSFTYNTQHVTSDCQTQKEAEEIDATAQVQPEPVAALEALAVTPTPKQENDATL